MHGCSAKALQFYFIHLYLLFRSNLFNGQRFFVLFATMSATPELDPTILKALGYFHSNAFDSTEKLKAMLKEVIENSKR